MSADDPGLARRLRIAYEIGDRAIVSALERDALSIAILRRLANGGPVILAMDEIEAAGLYELEMYRVEESLGEVSMRLEIKQK